MNSIIRLFANLFYCVLGLLIAMLAWLFDDNDVTNAKLATFIVIMFLVGSALFSVNTARY